MRFAVDANAPWMPWYFGDAAKGASYAAAFRRMSAIFKAALPRLKIDFNFNRDAKDPKLGFPGRQYVDLISIGGYFEQQYRQGRNGPQFCELFRAEAVGLDFTDRWAAELGVPWALAEFGCKGVTDADGAAWLDALTPYLLSKASRLAYVSYFNERWAGGDPLVNVELTPARPQTRAAFIRQMDALRGSGDTVPVPVTPAPIPVTPAPVEIAPVAANPALDLCARINGEAYLVTKAKTYSGPALAVYYAIEDLAYWPKAGKPLPGKEPDPMKALALIRDAVAAVDTKGWPAAARAQVRGWHDAAVALVGEAAQGVTPPVVVTPAPDVAEIEALKVALAEARAEAQAVTRKLEAVRAAAA